MHCICLPLVLSPRRVSPRNGAGSGGNSSGGCLPVLARHLLFVAADRTSVSVSTAREDIMT